MNTIAARPFLRVPRTAAPQSPATAAVPQDRVEIGSRPSGGPATLAELSRRKGVDLVAHLDEAMAALDRVPLSALDESKVDELAHRIPKVDLHRHLEGSIEPESLIDVAQRHHLPLPSYQPDELRPFVQITDKDKSLIDFLKKFDTIGPAFVSREVISDLTRHVIADASKDNVKYLELRFSPMYMARAHNLPLEDVVKGVVDGVKHASRDNDTRVNLILIVEREMGIEPARVVEKLAEKYKDRGVVALDLANDEFHYPPGPYAKVFQDAKKAGLKVTVHAGEAAGPENVKTSILDLGADRIGHGVRTYQDPEVEKLVRIAHVPLELCYTSNLQTGAVSSEETYPAEHYSQPAPYAPVVVTLNTDDPAVEGITLSHDFAALGRKQDLDLHTFHDWVINGVSSAFAQPQQKVALAEKAEEGFADARHWLAGSLTPARLKSLALVGLDHENLTGSQYRQHKAALEAEIKQLEATTTA